MYEVKATDAIDAYKLGHIGMYPSVDKSKKNVKARGTSRVYCNLTARSFRLIKNMFPNDMPFFDEKAVVYGLSASVQEIVELFNNTFFSEDIDELMAEFEPLIIPFAGGNSVQPIVDAFRKLHALGYLPLVFKTLPEGTLVGENVPMMTWTNTHDDFEWLPNYLETIISDETWKMPTSATIARVYKNIFKYYADLTGVDRAFCEVQGHTFADRGMSGIVDAAKQGSAHYTSFGWGDSVSAVGYINKYYFGKQCERRGMSVPATEHSVMCMGGKETELDTYRTLMEKYPRGILSIVSDTWDYWDLIVNGTNELKEEILAREEDDFGFSKVVFRPDSGSPEDILCGTNSAVKEFEPEIDQGMSVESHAKEAGSVAVLMNNFGYDTKASGFKTINQRVGLIYGDAITPVRAHNILKKFVEKGFASDNSVFGIGSYSYQFVTRDSLGFAVKATAGVIDDELVLIQKSPKTGSGKNSANGYMRVDKIAGEYVLVDNLETDEGGHLSEIFRDGKFINLPTFDEIRERLESND